MSNDEDRVVRYDGLIVCKVARIKKQRTEMESSVEGIDSPEKQESIDLIRTTPDSPSGMQFVHKYTLKSRKRAGERERNLMNNNNFVGINRIEFCKCRNSKQTQ